MTKDEAEADFVGTLGVIAFGAGVSLGALLGGPWAFGSGAAVILWGIWDMRRLARRLRSLNAGSQNEEGD